MLVIFYCYKETRLYCCISMTMDLLCLSCCTFNRYCQIFNIGRTNFQTLMFLVSSCSCLRPIYWSPVLSRDWRCSRSSADRWCSNYIWVINNFIANEGGSYIRGFKVDTMCNTIHFLSIPDSRHPITHLWVWGMGCLFLLSTLMFCLSHFSAVCNIMIYRSML